MNYLKLIAPILLVVLLICAPSSAQNPKLEIGNLKKLMTKAEETIDITLEGDSLSMVGEFLKSSKVEGVDAKGLISSIKGVYIKGAEFQKDNQYSIDELESIHKQLQAPGWERIVGVHSKEDRERVEVYLMFNDKLISGIGILIYEPGEFMVVNIVGSLEPAQVKKLSGKFNFLKGINIPKSSK